MSEAVGPVATDGSPLPGLIATLARLSTDCDDAVRIDQIRQLEELKSAAAAAQARMTAAFVASQRAANRAAGVEAEHAERGIAHQVGLAKRTSPFQARRYVGWANILNAELPHTFAELSAGRTTEWRAMIVARETGWLSREHRSVVDAELAPQLESLGDRRTENQAKAIAYRLDPYGYTHRLGKAETERRVTLRPAPDVMARLTALLPVAEGIAAHTALARTADALVAAGDPRTRSQLMADLLVQRLTGQATADAVPVEIQLVLDADTLLTPDTHPAGQSDPAGDTGTSDGREDLADLLDACGPGGDTDPAGDRDLIRSAGSGGQPAWLTGYGPIPAPTARQMVLRGQAPRWIRRLFTRPGTSELVAMDSKRRLFTEGQRRFITARDQVCRTPWCEAPIRHIDHIVPAEQGGPTSTGNAGGRCVACNLGKQAPGWHEKPGHADAFTITTPAGHTYRSRAPVLIHRTRHSPIQVVLDHWPHPHAA